MICIFILLPDLIRLGILTDFVIRQDHISRVLCIQKEEAVNLCEGNCYLSQKLRETQEKKEENGPLELSERLELLYFLTTWAYTTHTSKVEKNERRTTAYGPSVQIINYYPEIFHPPDPPMSS